MEESIEKYGFMEFTSGYHSQDYDVKFPLRFSSMNFILIIFLQKPREGGGYLGYVLLGMCHWSLGALTLFQGPYPILVVVSPII